MTQSATCRVRVTQRGPGRIVVTGVTVGETYGGAVAAPAVEGSSPNGFGMAELGRINLFRPKTVRPPAPPPSPAVAVQQQPPAAEEGQAAAAQQQRRRRA